jgi:hypothetical protein
MNVSADQVRAAARAAAAVITADKLPPLRLDEPSVSRRPASRIRPTWFTPLAAAAAVVIVLVGSLAAGSALGSAGKRQSGNTAAPDSAGSAQSLPTWPGAFSAVPRYYLTLRNSSLAVVRATATGATLARVTTHTPFVGVAGAADDRTFVLDAQNQVVGATVTWPGRPEFSLLQLTASGAEASYRRLALAPPPKGAAVTALALNPDGSELAVEVTTGGGRSPSALDEIRIYTLATGAYRTWFTYGSTDSEDPNGFTGSGIDGSESISWSADSRTLAFDWSDKVYHGVRLLDTAASGDNLITDSRLAVIDMRIGTDEGTLSYPLLPKGESAQCLTVSIMSLDGSSIDCGLSAFSLDGNASTTAFVRYSASTGKPVALIGDYHLPHNVDGTTRLFWINATGTTGIGVIGTPSGDRIGVIDGKTFTPLPGLQPPYVAAW